MGGEPASSFHGKTKVVQFFEIGPENQVDYADYDLNCCELLALGPAQTTEPTCPSALMGRRRPEHSKPRVRGPAPPTRQNPSKPAVIPGPYSANRVKIIDFRPKNGIFLRPPRQNHASGRAPLVAPSSNARGRQNHGGRSGPRQNHASGGAPRATLWPMRA